jgi:hypothetical protein
MICFWALPIFPRRPHPDGVDRARQARDIPALRRAGNLNSLLGQKNSLFGRVGNFGGIAWNVKLFGPVFPKSG